MFSEEMYFLKAQKQFSHLFSYQKIHKWLTGTVTFERESGNPFLLKNVMHVPGLKKNLVSVVMLEDKGYDVVFSEGKAFL